LAKFVASLEFRDLEANCRGYACTSAGSGIVALVLSLEVNGDVEVFVSPSDARAIAAALEAAALLAEGAR
jgi:hypothetical protein